MSRTCPDCHNTYDDDVLHCPEDGVSLTDGVADDLIGHIVGSYRVVKLLGKGGMGSVYMAEHPAIGSKVAIKFLHPQYSHDEKIVDRFFNEARAVNVIGHDNILKILDLDVTDDNRHYFVMEFLHGRPLQSLLKGGGPVPLQVSGPIVLQVCDALGAAHEAGIVHRDLKPDNVYLIALKGKKNFVKVVDFGIAKLTNSEGVSTGKTQTGMVMGTPAYMSPEQASGRTQLIDARSDIYSLGVMMFQLATGRLPFPGAAFGEVLIGHIQLPPPRPRDLNPAVPEGYETVILRTLQKRQEDRFQSMEQLHEAISRVMGQLGISTELPPAGKSEDMDTIASRGSPSNPGARTPSQPGRSTDPRAGARRSSPGRSQPASRPRASTPGRPRAAPGRPQPRAQEPEDQPTLPGEQVADRRPGSDARRRRGGEDAQDGGPAGAAAARAGAGVRGGGERPARGAREGELEGWGEGRDRAPLNRGAPEREGPPRDHQVGVHALPGRPRRRRRADLQRQVDGARHRFTHSARAARAGARRPQGAAEEEEERSPQRRADRHRRRPQVGAAPRPAGAQVHCSPAETAA